MRKPVTIFVLAAITWVITDVHADGVSGALIKHQTNHGQFNFKTCRELRGAELSVYTTSGECILSQKLRKKKISVDFSRARFGEYIIQITSANRVLHEYRFLKK